MQSTIKTIYGGSIMRTIEDKIIQTLNGGNGVKSLTCRDRVKVDGNTKKYYLWDSLLFWNDVENNYYFSFCGYSTNTTKSRLNAIFNYFNLGGFYQKNYVVYWNNGSTKIEVDINKKYKIVFFDKHAVKIEVV